MQTLYDLSPAGLSQVLNEKHSKILQTKETINQADFLKTISKNFIDSVSQKLEGTAKLKCYFKGYILFLDLNQIMWKRWKLQSS